MRTIDLGPLSIRAALGSVNQADRSAELVFSTGAAVERVDWAGKRYREVLSLDPKHVRLDRLNSGAPLLDAHQAGSLEAVLGVVESGSARIVNGQALARVRFSKRASVEPVWQDVRDKVLRNVSIGYRVHRFEETPSKDGQIPTRTAVDWEPYEVSLVPMGADAGAQVRQGAVAPNPCVIVGPGDSDAGDLTPARFLRVAIGSPLGHRSGCGCRPCDAARLNWLDRAHQRQRSLEDAR